MCLVCDNHSLGLPEKKVYKGCFAHYELGGHEGSLVNLGLGTGYT